MTEERAYELFHKATGKLAAWYYEHLDDKEALDAVTDRYLDLWADVAVVFQRACTGQAEEGELRASLMAFYRAVMEGWEHVAGSCGATSEPR